jgi:hypothetical protein
MFFRRPFKKREDFYRNCWTRNKQENGSKVVKHRTTGAFELCGQTRLLQHYITGQQRLSGDTSAIVILF